MDRGAWWATVHGVAESDMTKHPHTCGGGCQGPSVVQLHAYLWSLFLVWSCTHGDYLHPTVLHHILRDYSCWKTCLTSDYCMLSCALRPCVLLAIYLRMLHAKLYLNIFKNLFPIPLIQYNQSEIVEDHLLEMMCTWENSLLQSPKCITFQ